MVFWLWDCSKKRKYINNRKKPTDALLDRFYEELESDIKNKFGQYIVKASELNSSFFVLIKRYRGKILGEQQKYLFDQIKEISQKDYRKFSQLSLEFQYKYFPYFKLVESYWNYQFHFLVVKRDYIDYGRNSNKTVGI